MASQLVRFEEIRVLKDVVLRLVGWLPINTTTSTKENT